MIAVGHPNRPTQTLSRLQAIVVHYTANEHPGATDIMNARYFGRAWLPNPQDTNRPFEADGRNFFRFGSTQMLFDMDSGTQALPLNNVSWAAGDRPLPYTTEFKGQQPIARHVFGNSQNFRTLNIEVCNNDVIRDSDEDWEAGVVHAKRFIKWVVKSLGCTVNPLWSMHPHLCTPDTPQGREGIARLGETEILILRHHDLSGKMCPTPLIGAGNSRRQSAWENFIREVSAG
jgi:N-acetylmuramoyl-L-alanine amidase CwlA